MNLGIDIDNVVSDFDGELKKEFLKEDKRKRNTGVINSKLHIVSGQFDWSKEEVDNFLNANMERIAQNLKPRRNARKVLEELRSEGHKIFLISHRVFPHYKNPKETTENWLKKWQIPYDKLIFSGKSDKTKESLENKIDIMLDDRADKCEIMANNGITCFVMKTKYMKKHKLKTVTSWNNFLKEVENWGK